MVSREQKSGARLFKQACFLALYGIWITVRQMLFQRMKKLQNLPAIFAKQQYVGKVGSTPNLAAISQIQYAEDYTNTGTFCIDVRIVPMSGGRIVRSIDAKTADAKLS